MKLLSYIDGLSDLDSLKQLFLQIPREKGEAISLLHVIPEGNCAASANTDYSLTMAPNSRSNLLDKLASLDAEKNKINNDRARIIIDHAVEQLSDADIAEIEPILKRGDFITLLNEYALSHDILVLDKKCEHHFSRDLTHITHYLEAILHKIDQPILVMDKIETSFSKVLFAFDGSENTLNALSFLESKPFAHLEEVHILSVNMDDTQKLSSENAEKRLSDAGYRTVMTFKEGNVSDVITDMMNTSDADFLVAGAYSHSKIRHFFLGSTTNKLLKSLKKPLLLF